MRKPITPKQRYWHVFTGALTISAWVAMPIFVWYGHVYGGTFGHMNGALLLEQSMVLGIALASIPTLWHVNTEVAWRRREDRLAGAMKKIITRVAPSSDVR